MTFTCRAFRTSVSRARHRLGYRVRIRIVQLDWCVGELMKTLDRRSGLGREHALVVFCSDNGPVMDDGYADEALEKLGCSSRRPGPSPAANTAFYEGGTRTPSHHALEGPLSSREFRTNWFAPSISMAASLAALAGGRLPEGRGCVDSLRCARCACSAKNGAKGRTDHLVQQDNGRRRQFRPSRRRLEAAAPRFEEGSKCGGGEAS